jgi:hypothetical protein
MEFAKLLVPSSRILLQKLENNECTTWSHAKTNGLETSILPADTSCLQLVPLLQPNKPNKCMIDR